MTDDETDVDANHSPGNDLTGATIGARSDATSRMARQALLQQLIVSPTPACLRQLHARLLVAHASEGPSEANDRALVVASELHGFLVSMESTLDARHFSHLASLMDIGSVGAAALESLVDPTEATLAQVALAALSAGLMVAGTRQHVTAWSQELELPLAQGVWFLREELWRLSVAGQPSLTHDERLQSIDDLLSPMLDARAPREDRLALLGRTFQLVLLAYLTRALATSGDGTAPEPSASD